MRSLDLTSLLIGVLATALVAVVLGAGQQQPAPAAHRYQFAGVGKTLLVFDNNTGIMSVVDARFEKNDFGWFAEDQFRLEDTLTRKTGGLVTAGPGRHHDPD